MLALFPVPGQEMGLKVGQEASFAVQLNGARGLIDAKIHTPSGAIEECFITELENGEAQHCQLFVPHHSDIHVCYSPLRRRLTALHAAFY